MVIWLPPVRPGVLGVQLGQALAQHLDPERGAGPMVVDGGALATEQGAGLTRGLGGPRTDLRAAASVAEARIGIAATPPSPILALRTTVPSTSSA